jgi:O-antigen/teichoic acid export membrane protein
MLVKQKLIFVSAGVGTAVAVSVWTLIHTPGPRMFATLGITLGAVTVFDWLLILCIPQLRSYKKLRRIWVLLLLPSPFLALGGVALSYRRTFYYGLISLIVGVLLSKSLWKTAFDEIAGLQDIMEKEARTHELP